MKIRRIVAVIATVVIATTATVFLYRHIQGNKEAIIYDFDDTRDMQEIVDLFKPEHDRYWLLANPDYSEEFMLKYRAPSQDMTKIGQLTIKVCRTNNQFVGFTAYYMQEPQLGWLLFLAVKPEFRGKEKRYAEMLLRYAVEQMHMMGATRIRLLTRTDNIRAQKLYRRVGFQEVVRNSGFVYFDYIFL